MSVITVDGVRLEYQVIESTQGPDDTLVFLHEGLGSVAGWRDYPAKIAAATRPMAPTMTSAGLHGM